MKQRDGDGGGRQHSKRVDGGENEQQPQLSIGDREMMLLDQNPENTFNLGGTASIASIYGDLNASMLSTASGASGASGTSNMSGVSEASSDVMNQTTLSDTHELSTSNFIMSARGRSVVRERAKSLGLGDASKNMKGEKKNRVETAENDLAADENASKGVGVWGEPSLTLPDLTLGDLDDLMANAASEREKNDRDEEMEFTSHQRGTPVNNDVSIMDDSTASSLGLNGILAGIDDIGKSAADMDAEKEEMDETGDLSLGLSSIKSVDKNGEQSIVESTASQNDLDKVLNGVETEEEKRKEPVHVEAVSKPSSATPDVHPTPQTAQLNSTLRQSPSFISGKKKSLPWRKSMGGEDLAKIRALTASLKKSNRDKLRMSLPAANTKPVASGKNDADEDRSKDSARALFPEGQQPVEKDAAVAKSSSGKSQPKSPTHPNDSPAKNTRIAKKSPAKAADEEILEFTSHQRNTPSKKSKDLALLDESSTASSLGLNDILADISDVEGKSSMEDTGDVSLTSGSSKKSPGKPPKSPTRKHSRASSPIDSPARNTRSAKKSPAKSPSQSMDSPARNTRSAKKSPAKSPSQATDSPARNTRSAKKSPVESSPARSLFNSPLSPSAYNQLDSPAKEATSSAPMQTGEGPFSGRKRSHSPVKDAKKPLKKRLSVDSSHSEPSNSPSLSKEFPFLNTALEAVPAEKDAKTHDATMDCGTDTIEFNQLMKEMEEPSNNSAVSEEGSNASGLSSFSEDDSMSSAKQVRNKRRETADLSDLALILGGKSVDATASEGENITPPPAKLHTPRAGSSTVKTPKSILNSNKAKSRSNKKLVMFGSPETAIYNIGSPSTSFTPMQPTTLQEKAGTETEVTTELEGDITQMIAKASDPSLMGPIDESRIEAEFPSDASSIDMGSSNHLTGDEKTEELETNIYSLMNNSGEESEFSLPSVSEEMEGTPSNVKLAEQTPGLVDKSSDSAMDVEETVELRGNTLAFEQVETTQTVAIEGTMAALLDAVPENSKGSALNDSQTMEIEGTIASLLHKADVIGATEDDTPSMNIELTVASIPERATEDKNDNVEMSFKRSRYSLPASSKPNKALQETNFTYSTLTIPLEISKEKHSPREQFKDDNMAEPTNTVQLDDNLEKLLDSNKSVCSEHNGSIQFSKEHVSGEDDTVSELGMNTSQELSNNSASLDKIAEEEPLEPVDLEMVELVDCREDVFAVADSDDVMLTSLDVASKHALAAIKCETEDVLSQVCTDIEGQISMIDVEAEFTAILHKREDVLRPLQRHIRAKHDETMVQLKHVVKSCHASTQSEWDSWLTQVANLYNDTLHDTVVGELEKDSISISDKTSNINHDRDEVALPMLLQSASRARKRNYISKKADMSQLTDQVTQLEAELKDAQQKLDALTQRNESIMAISKSTEEFDSRSTSAKNNCKNADKAFYKFFSTEKLHNWILTSSNDSYIGLVFKCSSIETNLHLSFWITESSNAAFDCKIGPLPRSVAKIVGKQQARYHPAVNCFLDSKMTKLCHDLKENTQIDNAPEIAPLIQSVEHRVARIEHAAKEFDMILRQFKNSFLQPSDALKDGFDFHAYVTNASSGARVQVTLTLSECYPFAPIGVRIHSTDRSVDTDSMARQLQKIAKPGFGALSKAMDALKSSLR